MPFLLLFLLTLTCLQPEWPAPPSWVGETGCVVFTWSGIGVAWLWAAWWTVVCRRRLLRDPGHRNHWLRRFNAGRARHFFALLGFFLAASFLGWGWTIKPPECNRAIVPGLELLLLTPMVLGLVGSWALYYPMERAAHDVALYPDTMPFLSRWAYVGLQARHNLLLVVPPLTMLLIHQVCLYLFPELAENGEVVPVLGLVLLAVAFLCIPLLLRVFLGLHSMPPGPLRERLENAGRRLQFRFSDILVWDTQSTVANAMVTGVVPWIRYVVITDRLIETLTQDEIEGVFGHEVGHIKHHHIFFYLLFLFTSLIALGGLCYLGMSLIARTEVQAWFHQEAPDLYEALSSLKFYALLPMLALFALYMFIVFGFLSRRCERQADIFGCRTTTPRVFMDALEKVALLNGISRDKPGWLWSWQHGTIGQRVGFLEKLQNDAAVEMTFQRRLFLLKWGVVFLMVFASAGILAGMNHLIGPGEWLNFLKQL